jgi:hypothetical protein
MKKIISVAIFILISSQAFGQAIPEGVYIELTKFSGLTPDYIHSLPKAVNDHFLKNEDAYHTNLKSTCVPRFDAQYISNLTLPLDSAAQDFESAFIGIDATLCFEDTSVEKVIALFGDREFQASSVSTIKDSYLKSDLICEKTTAPTIGNSHYCYDRQLFARPNYILSFSFNVWNDSVQNANAPVYFREVMASANQTGNVTEFHLQTLVRGPKLNFFQKMFAKGAISSEQQSVYEKMKQRLQ